MNLRAVLLDLDDTLHDKSATLRVETSISPGCQKMQVEATPTSAAIADAWGMLGFVPLEAWLGH